MDFFWANEYAREALIFICRYVYRAAQSKLNTNRTLSPSHSRYSPANRMNVFIRAKFVLSACMRVCVCKRDAQLRTNRNLPSKQFTPGVWLNIIVLYVIIYIYICRKCVDSRQLAFLRLNFKISKLKTRLGFGDTEFKYFCFHRFAYIFFVQRKRIVRLSIQHIPCVYHRNSHKLCADNCIVTYISTRLFFSADQQWS